MEEFKGDQVSLAMASEGDIGVEERSNVNDFEGHQWIMDTGCGSDLASKFKVEDHKMRREKANTPIQLQTANGNTDGVEAPATNIGEFDESIEPYILPDTPSVLSIGRRCVHGGYHVVWLAGKHPYLVTPSRKLVALAVEDDTPYHISGDPRCQPVEPTHEMSIPCLLEHMRDVAGQDVQPAAPAEPKESADDMLEAAIRELAADDPMFGPPVSGHPAGIQAC